jgi:hypothetical protein
MHGDPAGENGAPSQESSFWQTWKADWKSALCTGLSMFVQTLSKSLWHAL